MALYVIVGASAVGTALARLLAAQGDQVRLVTRRGSGPEHPAIERIAVDATDAARLSALAQGAAALYNCASPPYDRWPTEWPPLASALLIAAERTGAVLASHSNLYSYGPVVGSMTEATPLAVTHPKLRVRADMWREALARHEAGRIRMTEIRASDHMQPNSIFALALCQPLLAGKRAVSPVPLDIPRSWTSVNDAARLLAIVAQDPRAWGKVWHVPTNAPMTARELVVRFSEVNGLRPPKLAVIPYPVVWTMGMFVPMLRELRATRYQFDRPFVIDSSAATTAFGLKPEPLDESLRDTARLLLP